MRTASFDALVTDYNLREGTGTALIDQARNEGLLAASVPTLICTGYEFIRAPAGVAVLHKPVDLAVLIRLIDLGRAASDEGAISCVVERGSRGGVR